MLLFIIAEGANKMSLYALTVLFLCAQLLLNILMLFVAFRISTRSMNTYESECDNALEEWKDEEEPITVKSPVVDHTVWANQPTFQRLPAWKIYDGPTKPERALKHQFMEANIGSSRKGLHLY